jgi:hypothetical protein
MPNTPDRSSSSDQQSRILGGLVVLGAVLAGSLFLAGVFSRNPAARYWALAIPVGAAVLFVLSLVVWIGWTILTVHTEASGDPLPPAGSPGGPTATPLRTEGAAPIPAASAAQSAARTPAEPKAEASPGADTPQD